MTITQSRQRLKEAEEAYKSAHPGKELTVAREELTHARTKYHLDCVAVVERLPDMLCPFVRESALWHKSTGLDSEICTVRDANDLPDPQKDSCLILADLRNLADLYEEVKHV